MPKLTKKELERELAPRKDKRKVRDHESQRAVSDHQWMADFEQEMLHETTMELAMRKAGVPRGR